MPDTVQTDTAESVQANQDTPATGEAIAELFATALSGPVVDVTDAGVVVTFVIPWSRVADIRTPPPLGSQEATSPNEDETGGDGD